MGSTTKAENPERSSGLAEVLGLEQFRSLVQGIAATACARKLLTAIWCMVTRGETFHHAEQWDDWEAA